MTSDATRPDGRELLVAFLKVGLTSFGGPLVAMSLIHREAVERRKLVTTEWFASTLGILQAIPGPSAFEMSVSVGIARRGRWGGVVSGLAYTLPGFFLMLGLSAAYVRFGALPAVAGLLAGLKPAALAVLAVVAVRLTRKILVDKLDVALWAGATAACLAGVPATWVVLAGGALGLAARGGAAAPLAAALPLCWLGLEPEALGRLPSLFAGMLKAGALVVGGGYNIAAFLADDFVGRRGWLSSEEFLAGFALAQFKPGPIILMSVFVGYKAAGLVGALVAAFGVFLPCVGTLLAVGPHLERLRGGPRVSVFLRGMGAAAVGTIAAAAAELFPPAVSGPYALPLFGAAGLALLRLEPGWVLAGSAVAGLVLSR